VALSSTSELAGGLRRASQRGGVRVGGKSPLRMYSEESILSVPRSKQCQQRDPGELMGGAAVGSKSGGGTDRSITACD